MMFTFAPPTNEQLPKRNGSSKAEAEQQEIGSVHNNHTGAIGLFSGRCHLREQQLESRRWSLNQDFRARDRDVPTGRIERGLNRARESGGLFVTRWRLHNRRRKQQQQQQQQRMTDDHSPHHHTTGWLGENRETGQSRVDKNGPNG